MSDHSHPQSTRGDAPPTAKQERYLRTLAEKRGVSFVPPRTRTEASRAIRELLRRSRTAARTKRATGAPSRTRWRTPATTRASARASSRATGLRHLGEAVMSAGTGVELARYTITAGERVVWGQRIDGIRRLSDVAAGRARAPLPDRARHRVPGGARRDRRGLPEPGGGVGRHPGTPHLSRPVKGRTMNRPASDELERVLSDLLARYVERRDAGVTPCAP